MEVDVIDVRDPDRGRARERWLNRFGTRSVRVQLPRQVDVAGQMVGEISRLVPRGELRTLRIWSEAPPGYRRIAAATDPPDAPAQVILMLSRELGLLQPLFATGAHVELRGCGQGLRGAGRLYAQSLARIWGVPVQAGAVLQTTGEWKTPIIQAAPSGAISLATGARVWSRPRAG